MIPIVLNTWGNRVAELQLLKEMKKTESERSCARSALGRSLKLRALKPNSFGAFFRRFPKLNSKCDRLKTDKEWSVKRMQRMEEHVMLPPSFFNVECSSQVK